MTFGIGTILGDGRYRIERRIGQGAFGVLYLASDLRSPATHVAVKAEPSDAQYPQLVYEWRLYSELGAGAAAPGVPALYYTGEHAGHNFIAMQLLGYSVEELFNYCGRKLGLKTVLSLGMAMLRRIQHVHSRGFIHRDIKPDNFLFGLGQHAETLYLIDFGLCKRYVHPATGAHIPDRADKHLTGTPRYASVRTHEGRAQSRRDDIEALAYVLLYLLHGSLPWQGKHEKKKTGQYSAVRKLKAAPEALAPGTPPEIARLLTHARGLAFEAVPDYAGLMEGLEGLFARSGFAHDGLFDWSSSSSRTSASRTSASTVGRPPPVVVR